MKKDAKMSLKSKFAYMPLMNDLRKNINSGKLKSGDVLISERKLASMYGINYTTVRKVTQMLAEEGLLIKVPGKGVFVKEKKQPKACKNIGMYVPTLLISHYAKIVETASAIISEKGHNLLLNKGDEGKDKTIAGLEKFLATTELDGLIMTQGISQEGYWRQLDLCSHDLKVIVIDGMIRGENIDYVKSDNAGGAFLATEHLLSQGIKKILCISGGLHHDTAREKKEGYEAAMRKWGLTPWIEHDGFSFQAGVQVMENVLKKGKIPDGLVATNDLVAMGAIKALKKYGLRIPEDVAVVGFNNFFEAEFFEVPISTVEGNIGEMTKLAVTRILEQLDGENGSPQQVIYPVHLIIRESSRKSF